MNATTRLIQDTILATPACPDGPTGACPSCLAHAVSEALEVGATSKPEQVDGQLDILQAVCSHVWPPELDADSRCELCWLEYGQWVEQR